MSLLKDYTSGTVTDFQGQYSVPVPTGDATNVFSFIGLKPGAIPVDSRSVIDVQSSAGVTQLSEVVVTGYGMQQESVRLLVLYLQLKETQSRTGYANRLIAPFSNS